MGEKLLTLALLSILLLAGACVPAVSATSTTTARLASATSGLCTSSGD